MLQFAKVKTKKNLEKKNQKGISNFLVIFNLCVEPTHSWHLT